MNLYEHTIIARQDVSPSQIKNLKEKYSKLIQDNKGNLVQTQEWGLLNLSYLIKKNKKGNYIHFKIEADGKIISELEKNEKLDKISNFLSDFNNSEYLLDYFEKYNEELSKKTLNFHLKGVINR